MSPAPHEHITPKTGPATAALDNAIANAERHEAHVRLGVAQMANERWTIIVDLDGEVQTVSATFDTEDEALAVLPTVRKLVRDVIAGVDGVEIARWDQM